MVEPSSVGYEEFILFFSAGAIIISMVSILITYLIYDKNQQTTKIITAYRMLFEVNAMTVTHPKVIIMESQKDKTPEGLTPEQLAYAAIVWNFAEGIYNLDLFDDKYLEPAIKGFFANHVEWLKANLDKYNSEFIEALNNKYPSKFK